MARKETVNTFTDGLISDLNPINTPNTVLTDCLNGTLITYDGNEYSLQNDKGNFPLKDCKLQENYIPVGVKEYGDILYIVSYNPITKHVQIGSYPSPETIFDEFDISGFGNGLNSDNNLKYEVNSLWSYIVGSTTYSELTENLEELKLFYGPIPENYKLNPGDKYKIAIKTSDANNAQTINNLDLGTFEGLEFYIFDENRKPYDITKNIEINTQNHVYTNWKVPGYMATKLRFAQVDDFKVNVRKVIVPTYTITNQNAIKELSLNFQYFISDYLYNDHVINTENSLKILIEIKRNGSSCPNIVCENTQNSPIQMVDLKNGTYCYYIDWHLPVGSTEDPNDDYKCDSNDKLELTITPFVELNNKKVYYDKFQRTLTFDLAQKGDVNDFEIGQGLWRYTVDNQLVLYFDTSGVQETSVFAQDVELQYKITRISNNTDIGDWRTVYDWNVVGDTILKIDFDTWTGSLDATKFYAEDYYTITFRFIDPETRGLLRNDLIIKNVLATELLNGNSSKKYDKIYFDEWINNYPDHIKNKSVNVNATIDSGNQATFVEKSDYYYLWMRDGKIKKYPTFIDTTDIDLSTNEQVDFTITAGFNFSTTIKYTSDLQLLTGPLWTGLSSTINYNDHTQKGIVSTTGLVDTTGSDVEDTQINKLEKRLRYLLQDSSIVKELFNLNDNEGVNISTVTLEANGIYENEINHSGGPGPDIEVMINGVKMPTLVDETTSYFNDTTNRLLSMFNSYDVLFLIIKFGQQTKGDKDPNRNSLRFKTGREFYTVGSDTVYASASVTEGSTTYYAVLRIKDTSSNKYKLLFVPIGNTTTTYPDTPYDLSNRKAVVKASDTEAIAHQKLESWTQNIKHITSDGTIVNGNFIKAFETTPDNRTPVINIETSPYLSFSQWIFLQKNLLLDSDRNTINSDDNFFKNSGNLSKNVLLSGIYFNSQNTELTYDGSTTELDALLNTEKVRIDARNTQITTEAAEASVDDYMNRYRDDAENIDVFIDETDPNSIQLLTKFLNKQQTCDTPVMLVATDYYNPKGEWPNNISYSNSEYSQYNYMGVTEVGLVINPTI